MDAEQHKKRKASKSDSSSDSASSASSSDHERERKKSKKHKKEKRRKHASSDSSDSDSDSSGDERERKKKSKKHKKEKKHKHKKEKKSKKKKKKHKKEKKSKKSVVPEFGHYGMITTADRSAKAQEFYLWLREVKKVEPEAQPDYHLTELFEDFVEDYITATMPHEKYYNVETWEAKEMKKRGKMDKATLEALEAKKEKDLGSFSLLSEQSNANRSQRRTSKLKMSTNELLEMQRVMRERMDNQKKKELGFDVDENKGVRTASMMRGLLGFGQKAL